MFDERVPRIPPQILEAEIAILRIMFHNNETIKVVKEKFSKSGQEFYKNSHQVIYKTMLKLFREKRPVDLITLIDELRNQENLDNVGGTSYLEALFLKEPPTIQNDGYSPDNLDYYIKIVYEKYLLRRLIVATQSVLVEAYEGDVRSLKRPLQKLISEGKRIFKESTQINRKEVDQ